LKLFASNRRAASFSHSPKESVSRGRRLAFTPAKFLETPENVYGVFTPSNQGRRASLRAAGQLTRNRKARAVVAPTQIPPPGRVELFEFGCLHAMHYARAFMHFARAIGRESRLSPLFGA